jgi:hypothetical protein
MEDWFWGQGDKHNSCSRTNEGWPSPYIFCLIPCQTQYYNTCTFDTCFSFECYLATWEMEHEQNLTIRRNLMWYPSTIWNNKNRRLGATLRSFLAAGLKFYISHLVLISSFSPFLTWWWFRSFGFSSPFRERTRYKCRHWSAIAALSCDVPKTLKGNQAKRWKKRALKPPVIQRRHLKLP